jgi:hypothetical protein
MLVYFGKTIINHPFGHGLYHLSMVIWGMVYGIVLPTLHRHKLRETILPIDLSWRSKPVLCEANLEHVEKKRQPGPSWHMLVSPAPDIFLIYLSWIKEIQSNENAIFWLDEQKLH